MRKVKSKFNIITYLIIVKFHHTSNEHISEIIFIAIAPDDEMWLRLFCNELK